MDTSAYPQLFDINSAFDTDLHQDKMYSYKKTDNFHSIINNDIYSVIEKSKKLLDHDDSFNNPLEVSNSFLNHLQSDNQNDFFYNTSMEQDMMVTDTTNNFEFIDTEYLQPSSTLDQKQQYSWLYDTMDTLVPHQNDNLFCDDNIMINIIPNDQPSFDSIMSENNLDQSTTVVEGGMSCGYVSLSDVNSFVAKADSLLLDDFSQHQRDFLSSCESANEESEDEYSDNNSDFGFQWPTISPTTYNAFTHSSANDEGNKLMIKIKKPYRKAMRTMSAANLSSGLPNPYGDPWDFISPKSSKSASYRNTIKHRKSMTNIYGETKKKNKMDSKGRRGSAPNKLTVHTNNSTTSLGGLHSSSSLASLTNNLQHSMRVSDSLTSFISEDEAEEGHDHTLEDEDDDDEDFHLGSKLNQNNVQIPIKKGRNVDKACNHCKRSHLRCDEMRPCRRCVATGKTGCKDVQHKPRGRPKLNKK